MATGKKKLCITGEALSNLGLDGSVLILSFMRMYDLHKLDCAVHYIVAELE